MIGIIGALDVEIEDITKVLTGVQIETFFGFDFYKGKYKEKDIVLLKCGVSKVNATIGATLLLTKYDVSLVITTGIAGGVNLKSKDIVLLNEYLFGDVDCTSFNYEIGTIGEHIKHYKDNSGLIDKVYKELSIKYDNVYIGTCVTQDKFITKESDIPFKRDILCCEMESTAIRHVCEKFNKKCLGIRYISDVIGEENQTNDYDEFERTTAHLSALLVLKIIDLL